MPSKADVSQDVHSLDVSMILRSHVHGPAQDESTVPSWNWDV